MKRGRMLDASLMLALRLHNVEHPACPEGLQAGISPYGLVHARACVDRDVLID